MVGYAAAPRGATLCATVFHVLRTNRLGVDIPFTHSPPCKSAAGAAGIPVLSVLRGLMWRKLLHCCGAVAVAGIIPTEYPRRTFFQCDTPPPHHDTNL